MNKNTKKLNEVVLIRVFTILIVVLGHSMIVYSSNWSTFEMQLGSTFFDNLKVYIDIFQMPLFIFISGYIYHFNRIEMGKYQNKNRFIKGKFIRLIIPYFSVAILYVIPIRFIIDYNGYQGKSFIELLVNNVVLGKDIGHLWFLPSIFTIFVIFYLFERFIFKFPLMIGILFFVGISTLSGFLPAVFFIQKSFNYLLYFYVGFKIRALVQDKESMGNPFIIIALFGLQFIGVWFSIAIAGQNSAALNGLILIFNKFGSLSSILFFYLLFNKVSIKKESLADNKLIKYIDKESFQIYLFHSPIVYIILYFIQDYVINPFIVVTGTFICCILGSILLSKLIEYLTVFNICIGKKQKIYKKNELIVNE